MRRTVIIIALGILLAASVGTVMSSRDWGEQDEEPYERRYGPGEDESDHRGGGWPRPAADVHPVENQTYRSECGDCHFAYQPGLLPQRDWARIMRSLSDHYGDDASLGASEVRRIRDYLVANAADRSTLSRSRAFAAQPGDREALPRITATGYFRREHYEIPDRLVLGNPEVGSFSRCQACHRNAEHGVYNEDEVVIPGVGRWDD
jgi:hypothetical protein